MFKIQIIIKKKNSTEYKASISLKNVHYLSFEQLNRYIPKWGAQIKNCEFKNVHVSNTCTIDYYLFCFFILYKTMPRFIETIPELEPTIFLKEIIKSIDALDWNKAKEIWILKIMKLNINKFNSISLFGTEYDMFVKYLEKFQLHQLKKKCINKCSENDKTIRDDADKLYFKKEKKVQLYSCFTGNCKKCKNKIKTSIRFDYNPNFLFIESMNNNIFAYEIPKLLKIDGKSYKLLCVTIFKEAEEQELGHFIGLFLIDDIFYAVDDLTQTSDLIPSIRSKKLNKYYNYITTTALYYLILN